jgi:CelD/BcsL family acetyltransferase involved in cellulose biosynthesis
MSTVYKNLQTTLQTKINFIENATSIKTDASIIARRRREMRGRMRRREEVGAITSAVVMREEDREREEARSDDLRASPSIPK